MTAQERWDVAQLVLPFVGALVSVIGLLALVVVGSVAMRKIGQ